MKFTWIKKIWNRIRGKHQRGIQNDGRSKYSNGKRSKESLSLSRPPTPPPKEEDDSGLYHAAAPPPIVIEPFDIEEDDEESARNNNNNYKQSSFNQNSKTPLRKPGGELHMIIEREHNSNKE